MIYTLTLNPALDYVIHISKFKEGLVNRTEYEELLYGGKGINTSAVLSNMGIENVALGFVGGNIGKEFEQLLNKDGISTDFIYLKNGNTRINIKIKGASETDINASGPNVCKDEIDTLFDKITALKENDFITLAGSIPSSVPDDIYIRIAQMLSSKNVNVVVDAEKNLLTDVLKYKPFLIKPNHHELGGIFGKDFKSKNEIISAARELQHQGARNVFVSRAGDGGIFLAENGDAYFSPAPSGKVINSTGAGDSLIAGFLAEYITTNDYKKAFIYGLCAGSASAFSERLAAKNEIDNLYNSFDIDKIQLI